MAPNPLIVVDTNYLAHRAFHAMGELRHEDILTGPIFGVFQDIVQLQQTLGTGPMAFAFDYGGKGHRGAVYPEYKLGRRERHAAEDDTAKDIRREFNREVKRMRTRYLPAAGFRNTFAEKGFEGDDIIASIVTRWEGEAVIVGSDEDLWQLLRPGVTMYNPTTRKVMTDVLFTRQWGIQPAEWPSVKAWAGCSSDDVHGVPGVGPKTAVKYLTGTLPRHHKTYAAMTATGGLATYNRNIKIVRLPYPGTPEYTIQPDEVTEERWKEVANMLGMKSMLGRLPAGAARKKRGRKRGQGQGKGFGLDRTE